MSLPEFTKISELLQAKAELLQENAALKDEQAFFQGDFKALLYEKVGEAVIGAAKTAAVTRFSGFEIMSAVLEGILMFVSILMVTALGLFILWSVICVVMHSMKSVLRFFGSLYTRFTVRVKTLEPAKAPISSKLVFVRGQPLIETAKGEYVEIPAQLLGFAAAQQGSAIVKEAAITGSTMIPIVQVPAYIVVFLNEDKIIGHGFRVGDYVYTAMHVYETLNPDFRFARPDAWTDATNDYKLNYVDVKKADLIVEDLGYDRVRFTSDRMIGVYARLGVGSGKFKVGSTAHTVRVYTHADGEWLRSSGQAKPVVDTPGITHTASTIKGTSGSPIIQNNCVVGIHLGYNPKYDANIAALTADQDPSFSSRIPPANDPLVEKEYSVSSSQPEGEPLADPRSKHWKKADEAREAGLDLTRKEKKAQIKAGNEGAIREGLKQDRLSGWVSQSSIGNWADLDDTEREGEGAEAEQQPVDTGADFHPRPKTEDVKESVKLTEKPKAMKATPKDQPIKAEMKVTKILKKKETLASSANPSTLTRPVLKRSETISVALGEPDVSRQEPVNQTVKLSRKQRRLANSQNSPSTETRPEAQSTKSKPSYRELLEQVNNLQKRMEDMEGWTTVSGKRVVTTGKVN